MTISVPAASPAGTTLIEFLLDETGSMNSCRAQTILGFNGFVVEQRTGALCFLTLTKFDTAGQRTPYVDLDINLVPLLTTDTYTPAQGTNLYDTIALRIASLEARLLTCWTAPPHVLFVIMTDGQDNASRTHSAESVKNLILSKEEQGWTFVYLGANQNAWQVGQTFGMHQGNTKTYDTAHMADTMRDLATSTKVYRTARASASVPLTSHNFFDGESNDAA